MRTWMIVLLFAGAAFGLAGCSKGDDGVKPEVNQQLTDAATLAKQVDGNYDKLTDSQKQVFLKMANGNEAQAKSLCHMIAHPPNEKYAKKPSS